MKNVFYHSATTILMIILCLLTINTYCHSEPNDIVVKERFQRFSKTWLKSWNYSYWKLENIVDPNNLNDPNNIKTTVVVRINLLDFARLNEYDILRDLDPNGRQLWEKRKNYSPMPISAGEWALYWQFEQNK